MTLKEQLFCHYFVQLQNHKEAAIKAGYQPAKADVVGVKLLAKKYIKKQIDNIMLENRKKNLLQKSIAGFERLAFGSVSDSIELIKLISDEVLEKDLKNIGDHQGCDEKNERCFLKDFSELDLFNISEIKKSKGGTVEIKFFDRFKALEKICEISQMASEHSQTTNLIDAIKQSAQAISNSDDVCCWGENSTNNVEHLTDVNHEQNEDDESDG